MDENVCRHGQPDQNHEDWDVDYPCLDCLEDEKGLGRPTGYDTLEEKDRENEAYLTGVDLYEE